MKPLKNNENRKIARIIKSWFSVILICLFLTSFDLYAQRKISGIVTDDSGIPLPGVSIVAKDGSYMDGATTNMDGKYELEVRNTTVLEFRFVGFITQSIKVGNETIINVRMETDNKLLDEVVVVGYGTVKKKDLMGAVSIVKSESLANRASSDIGGALKGLASGIKVTSSGLAGDAATINIRGIGNLTNNEPLFVIDGLPTSGGMDLNMQDIESIQILKDASSAAIYGSRAANGVIIVSTKKGKEGPLKVDVSVQLTNTWLPRYDLMNATEYKKFNDMAYDEAIRVGLASKRQNHYEADTDWQDEMLKNGLTQNYNVSLSGGNKTGNFFVSLNKLSDSGTMYDTSFDRYAFRVNTSGQKGIFSYGENLYIIHDERDKMYENPFSNFIGMAPTIPIYDEAHPGGYGYGDPDRANTYALNPIAQQDLNDQKNKQFSVKGNVYGQISLFDMFHAKLNFGYNRYNGTDDILRKSGNWTMGQGTDHAYLTKSNYQSEMLLVENTYNFKHTFGKHDVDALFGITYQSDKGTYHSSTRLDPLVIGDKYYDSIGAATGTTTATTSRDEAALISYLGRVNYAYDDKYLFSATIRRDGTSRLPQANHWGNFPSVSASWRISKERFFNVHFIDDLKIRANYGVLGNCNIGYWDFLPVMNTAPRAILGSPEYIAMGITQSKLVNQDITWEKKEQTNIGIDVTFLNNRLTFSGEYFISKGKDLLVTLPLLMTTGNNGGNPVVNAASLQNKGVEMDLGWRDKVGDFSYSVSTNFTILRNKVLELGYGQTEYYTSLSKSEIGKPLGSWYLYKMLGIFQSPEDIQKHVNSEGKVIQPNALPGDVKYDDFNDNGSIGSTDRQMIGNPWPKLEMGLSFSAQWKDFDILIQGYGRLGMDVYNGAAAAAADMANNQNNFRGLSSWTEQNKSTTQPRLVFGDSRNSRGDQDRWLENGSFFRVGEIALGYNLPKKWCDKISFRYVRAGVTFNNLITFTKYSGLDPDFKDGGIFTIGADYCSYPNPRSVLFVLSFGF